MLKNASFATAFTSLYALLFCVLIGFPETRNIAIRMFLFAPPLVIWMVYTILRYGKYNGPELTENQEYGYQDRD